jgi:hypothetical protein
MSSQPCKNCGSSDAVEPYDNGDYCFSCHTKSSNQKRLTLENDQATQKNPKEIKLTNIIPDKFLSWLYSRGLTKETVDHFQLQYDELSGSIAYPVKPGSKLVGYQLRDLNKNIKIVKYVSPVEPFYFLALRNNLPTVVIVEDPISAMRLWQDGQVNAIALLGTNLKTENKLQIVAEYTKIIVWMDGDIAGYGAARMIEINCSPWSETKILFTQKDPKDHSVDELRFVLEAVL